MKERKEGGGGGGGFIDIQGTRQQSMKQQNQGGWHKVIEASNETCW